MEQSVSSECSLRSNPDQKKKHKEKEEEQQKELRNQYQEYNENAGHFLNEYMTLLIS